MVRGGWVAARERAERGAQGGDGEMLWGDATRKKKLLEKQKAGKKKMRQFGKVEIAQEGIIAALEMDG